MVSDRFSEAIREQNRVMSLRFSEQDAISALCLQSPLELAHGDLLQRLRINIVRPHGRGLYARINMNHGTEQIGTATGELDQDL